MPYGECKVYFDGSHYIAIPHTTKPIKKRAPPVEEVITVDRETNEVVQDESTSADNAGVLCPAGEEINIDFFDESEEMVEEQPTDNCKTKQVTRKELFEQFYGESLELNKSRRKDYITEKMRPYFKSEDQLNDFIAIQLERKWRNLLCRRIRMTRKANLQEFNYFCTFTYSDAKHTEETFKKKLTQQLARFSTSKGWKYIGVWERSPEKQRLHFHGIFYIPDTSILGSRYERRDYNFAKKTMVITHTFPYMEEKFGRADFEPLEDIHRLGDALSYLMKYLEKTGEKIVYSKGLHQYFISDIMYEDIACRFGIENKKLLLYDDFGLWDEGCYMGRVSPENIKLMRKSD